MSIKSIHSKQSDLDQLNHYVNPGWLGLFLFIVNKRASLACAARLADTLCPPEAPFGHLEVTLVN